MRRLISPSLTLAYLLLAGTAHGACDVEAAVAQLEAEVVGSLDAKQRQDTRRILLAMCGNPPTSASDEAPISEAKNESTSEGLFGINVQRAEEGSRGHERLKKKR